MLREVRRRVAVERPPMSLNTAVCTQRLKSQIAARLAGRYVGRDGRASAPNAAPDW